jgi:ATP-binding cassette subfamily B protein
LADLPDNTLSAAASTNWGLIRRMLGVGWHYRWGCLRLVVLQGILQLAALSTLGITGYGIDLVRFQVGATDKLPVTPWDLHPPGDWPQFGQIALLAGLVLVLELLRGSLNYVYAISAGQLIHARIVPELRSRVYDKLQRLSFRFFDANATGTIIQRVTSDVQGLRAFIDGVMVQETPTGPLQRQTA